MIVSPKVDIILEWIVKNAPEIISAIKQIPDFAIAAAGLVQAHMDGRVSVRKKIPDGDPEIVTDIYRPDVSGGSERGVSHFSALQVELNEQRRSLSKVSEENDLQHNRMLLDIEIVELIISAQTFQRFANNLNIHASNLQIHFHSLKNQTELFVVITRQSEALAALKAAVDRLAKTNAKAAPHTDAPRIDVDIRLRDASLVESYEAFERTRDLLIGEIRSFSKAVATQSGNLDRVRNAASRVPSEGSIIFRWLQDTVEPQLASVKSTSETLLCRLELIPKAMTR